MALDNSTIQNPIPGDLQARVENALNLVTSLEAEHARLTKMCSNETQKINSLHEEKKSIESSVLSLKSNMEAMKGDETASKIVLIDLEAKKTLATNELSEILSQLKIATQELESKVIEKHNHEDAMAIAESDMNERLGNLREKETAHELKVERLKKAIE